MSDELSKKQLVELRKKQFEVAMSGDVRMLIWLGKQYLGQKETPDIMKDTLCEGFDLRVIDSVDFVDNEKSN